MARFCGDGGEHLFLGDRYPSLLRTEVTLSVWVFHFYYYIVEVLFHVVGWGEGTGSGIETTFGTTVFTRYSRTGAMVLAALTFLWASRHEWWGMAKSSIGRGPAVQHSWAIWGFFGGLAVYLAAMRVMGMQWSVALTLVAFFLVLTTVTARIVAASGLLWVQDYFQPMLGVARTLGTANITPQSNLLMGLADHNPLGLKQNLMPTTLDSLAIARRSNSRDGHVVLGIAMGIVFGLAV